MHADRLRAAEEAGALAVKLITQPIRPSEIITAASVENALRVLLALGGSTNALIHLRRSPDGAACVSICTG